MYYDKWWKNHGHHQENACETKKTVDQKAMANALGVVNIGGIFVVLLCGLAFAVMVAIIEFCWSSHISKSSDLISTREEEERKKNQTRGRGGGSNNKDDQGKKNTTEGFQSLKTCPSLSVPGTSLCTELLQTLAPYLYDFRSASDDGMYPGSRSGGAALASRSRSGGVATVGPSDCYSCDLVRDNTVL